MWDNYMNQCVHIEHTCEQICGVSVSKFIFMLYKILISWWMVWSKTQDAQFKNFILATTFILPQFTKYTHKKKSIHKFQSRKRECGLHKSCCLCFCLLGDVFFFETKMKLKVENGITSVTRKPYGMMMLYEKTCLCSHNDDVFCFSYWLTQEQEVEEARELQRMLASVVNVYFISPALINVERWAFCWSQT